MAKPLAIVTDDDDMLRMLNEAYMKDKGYDVRDFPTAEKALAAIKAENLRPDLIVTDYDMKKLAGGEITGVEYMQQLRAENPALPMVLVSGGVGSSKVVDFGEATSELNAVFRMKPYNGDDLNKAVDDAKALVAGKAVAAQTSEEANVQAAIPVIVYTNTDPVVRELMVEVLKGKPYKIDPQSDPAEAIAEVERLEKLGTPVALMTSLRNGLDIKKFQAEHEMTPVLIATGGPDPDRIPKGVEVLSLPASVDVIAEKVDLLAAQARGDVPMSAKFTTGQEQSSSAADMAEKAPGWGERGKE